MRRVVTQSKAVWLIAIVLLTSAIAVAPAPFAQAQNVTEPDAPDREHQEGPQDLLLEGQLTDAETDQPVPGAMLQIRNEWHHETNNETRKGYDSLTTETDAQGHYRLNVSQGRLQITIEADTYDRTHASLEINDDTTLNLELRPSQTDTMTVDVTVTNNQGEAIPNAHISLSPNYRTYCEGDVCYAEGNTGTAVAPEQGQDSTETTTQDGTPVHIRYDPHDDRYASDETDTNGQATLHLQAGNYTLRAWHSDYLSADTTITGDQGETVSATLQMIEIPPDSVTLTGLLRDADTGDPIPNAYVTVQNEQWGDWDNVRTDDNGEYTLQVKPGYVLIEARAEKTYWIPCEDPQPEPLPVEPDHGAGSSTGASGDSAPSTIASEPTPPRCDGQQEREHAYLPRVGTLQPEAGDNVSFDASLERAPAPDASFSGWVINASSQQGLPNASVSFYNEVANEWGQAEVDEDGSFQIDVRAGYYTIRVHAPGHFSIATNAQLDRGEDQRLVLEVPPGQPRYGGCCYAFEDGTRGGVVGGAEPAMEDGTAGQDSAAPRAGGDGDSASTAGAQVYTGSGGGLGPYQAGQSGERTTPLAGVLGVLAVIGSGALMARTRRA